MLAAIGEEIPAPSVLEALATGTTASPAVAAGEAGPDDLAIAPLEKLGALLLVGRSGHPFRRRERQQLLALGTDRRPRRAACSTDAVAGTLQRFL